MNQDSAPTAQVTHSKKGKASRWFKGILNIVRFKFKGTSKHVHDEDSSSENSTDTSSEENITFDLVDVDEQSSLSISSEDSSMIKVSHSPKPIAKNFSPQPSTSSHPRLNSSSVTPRPTLHQNPLTKCKPNSINNPNGPSRGFLKPKSFNYGPRPRYMQPIYQHTPRTSLLCSGRFPFRSPIPSNSKPISRNDDAIDGSLLVKETGTKGKSVPKSLAHEDASSKNPKNSLECIKGELYAPLKYVRMEVDNVKQKDKVTKQDEQKPKAPRNRFGNLTQEKSPNRRNENDKSTEIGGEGELDKLFLTSLRTVEILTKIMVDILTLKSDSS